MAVAEKYFNKALQKVTLASLARILINKRFLRKLALSLMDKKLYELIVIKNVRGRPRQVQLDKYHLDSALLYRAEQAYQRGILSPKIMDKVIDILIENVLLFRDRKKAREKLGFTPPSFITISPGEKCNLKCSGCYAASSTKAAAKLDFQTFDRILTEKEQLWGSHFTVISGGEPFLWKSNGKDLLDMVARHPKGYFMAYTNGTLVNRELAERMLELGNFTPAISVEGFEKETDERRGKGVHNRVLKTFATLQEAGVPFGISATVTRNNWDVITSDEFMDFYFQEQGAIYCWIFQYMPIGREHSIDMMVTPEQRLEMLKRTWRFVQERKYFIADFWNSGTVSDGCISAGREGGYFYINWNGDITPCVFIPYSCDNIYDVFRRGGNLNDVLQSSLFQKIRHWQDSYGFRQLNNKAQNWLCPCAIRDHFGEFHGAQQATGAHPIDKAALEAINDEGYCQRMEEYGKELRKLTDALWIERYLE